MKEDTVKALSRLNLFIFSFKKNIMIQCKMFLVFAFVVLICLKVMPQYSGSYNAAILDKIARLKEINGPKIVLIGDSNLAFGTDSPMIEEEIGMPVVNLGLHGAMGTAYEEELAKINVHEGDIYVLCHWTYDNDTIVHPELMWLSIEDHFEMFQYLRPKDIWPMVKAYPIYLKKCTDLYIYESGNNEEEDSVYARSAFNKYGDVSRERLKSKYVFSETDVLVPPGISKDVVDRINRLNNYMEEQGASLVVAGIPIGKGEFTADEEVFVDFQERLQEELDCEVISDFRDYMFDYNLFYDTSLHLTTEGAKVRTQQLISDLKKYIKDLS